MFLQFDKFVSKKSNQFASLIAFLLVVIVFFAVPFWASGGASKALVLEVIVEVIL